MEGSVYRLYYGIHEVMTFYAMFKHIQVCFIRRATVGMYKGVSSVTILGFFSSLTIAGIPLGPGFLGLSVLWVSRSHVLTSYTCRFGHQMS